MKTNFTLLAFLLCLCQFVNAQTTETPLADAPSYKNHFGIIASPTLNKFFTNNSELPVGLIYKRQGKNNGMFRGTLIGFSSQNTNDNNFYEYSFSPSNNMQITSNRFETAGTSFFVKVTGGYEWHVPLSNRWALFYGAEAGPTFSRNFYKINTVYANSGGENVGESRHRNDTYGIVIRPFSGIAFQVTDRVYIATETAILAHSYRYKSTINTSNIEPQATTHIFGDQSNKGTAGNISYKLISNISLLMRF